VRDADAAYAVGHPLQVLLPRSGQLLGHGLVVELVHHVLDDPVQQLLPARDVAVQRHRLHPELTAQSAHGQPVAAFGVDQVYGLAQDLLPAQRPALHRPGARVTDPQWSAAVKASGRHLSGHVLGHPSPPPNTHHDWAGPPGMAALPAATFTT
jgi:hypothetical protein